MSSVIPVIVSNRTVKPVNMGTSVPAKETAGTKVVSWARMILLISLPHKLNRLRLGYGTIVFYKERELEPEGKSEDRRSHENQASVEHRQDGGRGYKMRGFSWTRMPAQW